MKKYLTEGNLIIALLVIGISIIAIVIFFPSHKNQDALDMLKEQQKGLEKLTEQLQANDNNNRVRDSILLDAYLHNQAARDSSLQRTKQTANEKIDHINSDAFNADSIRRYFANN